MSVSADLPKHSPRRGILLVLGLVGFGLLLSGTLYVYARYHRGPFQELTIALAEEFPGSAPRIEGGKLRLDEPGPRILRVIMKTPPAADQSEADRARAQQVAQFLTDWGALQTYDVLELRFYSPRPGREISQRVVRLTVAQTQSLAHNGDASNR